MKTVPTQVPPGEPAAAVDVWRRLGAGIDAANLPAPSSVVTRGRNIQLMLDTDHDRTDLETWAAWLGAGKPVTQLGISHIYTRRSAKWRGWRIEVVLVTRREVAR